MVNKGIHLPMSHHSRRVPVPWHRPRYLFYVFAGFVTFHIFVNAPGLGRRTVGFYCEGLLIIDNNCLGSLQEGDLLRDNQALLSASLSIFTVVAGKFALEKNNPNGTDDSLFVSICNLHCPRTPFEYR